MAYAYCPKCRRSFRYSTPTKRQPRWLQEFGQTVGKGEKAVLLCFACWVVPEVGDVVEVLEPPYEPNSLKRGYTGTVLELRTDTAERLYVVAGTDPTTEAPWQHAFRSHQLSAAELRASRHIQLLLEAKHDA